MLNYEPISAQRDLFNRTREFSNLDARVKQRQEHLDELERLVKAREEEVERQWVLMEARDRAVQEAHARLVRGRWPWAYGILRTWGVLSF